MVTRKRPTTTLSQDVGEYSRFFWKHRRATLTIILFMVVWVRWGFAYTVLLWLLVEANLWVWVWGSRWLKLNGTNSRLSLLEPVRAYGLEKKHRAALDKGWAKVCLKRRWVVGETPLRLLSVKPIVGDGLVARIAPGPAVIDVEDIIKDADLIRQAIGCHEVKVQPVSSACAEMRVHWNDPVGRVVALSELPMPNGQHQLVYGIRADGSAATVSLEAGPCLVAAVSGAGKSNTIETMLADVNRRGIWTQAFISDPKGGMELSAFEAHVGEWRNRFQVAYYAKNVAETVKMVDELLKLMRTRQAIIRRTGERKLTRYTQEMPLIVVIFDDLLTTLPILSKAKPGEQSHLMVLLTESRSAAIFPVGAAQIAHATTLGDIRNAFPQRLGLRLPSVHAVSTVLSESAVAQGAMCHRLHPIKHRGVGWSTNDANQVDRFRSPIVTDRDLAAIVEGLAPAGMKTEAPAAVAKRHAVYRVYDAEGALLYVGETNFPKRRFKEHRSNPREPWWSVPSDPANEVVEASIKLQWFHGVNARAEAKGEQDRQIESDLPRYNTVRNRGWNPLRRRPRPVVVEGEVVDAA